MAFLCCLLIGGICGLRSMTAPALIAWGARLGWLHLGSGFFSFFANQISLIIFSLFAVGELIADKLPFIPPRTQPGPLIVRIVFGALCAAALGVSASVSPVVAGIIGGLGAIAGSFAGYNFRRALSSKIPDLLLALVEDAVAVGGGFLLISRL